MLDAIVIQRPDQPASLVLLFHGVGATADDLAPLGTSVAKALPSAMVVSVNAPHPSALGQGYEWFSVLGVTEQNRPGRVEQAMGTFSDTVAHWQHEAGLKPAHTTLIGFSQGAIMALESMRHAPLLAERVVSLSGRFASEPAGIPSSARIHLIHGEQDQVIPAQHSVAAAASLKRLVPHLTLDLIPALGHGIDARVATLVVARLKQPR
ncbi:MAG: esterase [Pseudomonadota bacterium]